MVHRRARLPAVLAIAGISWVLGAWPAATPMAIGSETSADVESARVGWARLAYQLEQQYRAQPQDLTVLRNLIVTYTQLSVLERGTPRGANLCRLIPERIDEFRKTAGLVSAEDDAVLRQCVALLAFEMGLYPVTARHIEGPAANGDSAQLKRALTALGQAEFRNDGELAVPCGTAWCRLAVWRLATETPATNAGSVFHYYFLPAFGGARDIPGFWLTLGSQQAAGSRRYYLYGHQGHHRKPLKIYGTREPTYEQLRQDVESLITTMAGGMFEGRSAPWSGRALVLLTLAGALVAAALVQAMRRKLIKASVSSQSIVLVLSAAIAGAAVTVASYAPAQPADTPRNGSDRIVIPPEAKTFFDDVGTLLGQAGISANFGAPEKPGEPTTEVPVQLAALPARPADPPLLPVLSVPTSPDTRQASPVPGASQRVVERQFEVIHAVQQRIVDAAVGGRISEELGEKLWVSLDEWKTAQKKLQRRPDQKLELKVPFRELIAAYESGITATGGAAPGGAGGSSRRAPSREIASGLLQEVFESSQRLPETAAEIAVKPAYSTHVFQIKPEGMDDAGPLVGSYKLDRIEVPIPQPPDVPPPAIIPNGVRILIDEGMLGAVLARQGGEPGLNEICALEDALLNARTPAEAARVMDDYTDKQQQRFLETARLQFSSIEKPHLVRLGALLRDLRKYKDRWDERPQSLRTVGELTSIDGYILDRRREDVWLIGERTPEKPPISIDCLIVGLRSIWKEGKSPICSLDSLPSAIAGVQRSRLVDVPGDSEFARIMLDADYAMKRIMFNAEGDDLKIEGFRPLEKVLRALSEGEDISGYHRFWLTAEEPGDHSILLGPYGLSALFRVRVRVETEEMFVAGDDAVVGAGRASPLRAPDAQAFTDHFQAIAEKRPIFRELEGLYQIALLARLLRLVTVRDQPILADLASMPHARVEVPAEYPGLQIEHRQGAFILEISGGCDLSPRASTRALLPMATSSHAALTDAISRTDEQSAQSVVEPRSLEIPKTADDTVVDSRAYLAAMQMLAQEDWSGAREAFTRLLDRHSTWAELFERRALAQWHLGDWRAAIWDAAMAIRLDPDEPEFRVTWFYLRLEGGDERAAKELSPFLRASLADRYYVRAYADAFEKVRRERALAAFARALELNPRHTDALSFRGMLRLETGVYDRALADFDAALQFSPGDDLVRCLRGSARSRLGDRQGALADYNDVTRRNPSQYFAWAFRADLRGQLEDYEGAIGDATRAIQLRPQAAEPFITRGSARAAAADAQPAGARPLWRGAADDLQRALELLPFDAPMRPAIEQLLRDIRQRLSER